jgi:8-hydroxy-5-deazaflavin:NADPH oxidoreductase
MPSEKVAVIGSGVIGRTLATRFAQAGYSVTFGARDLGNPDLAAFAAGIGASVADIGTAIDDAVLLAVNGAAMPGAVPAAGACYPGTDLVLRYEVKSRPSPA